MAELLSHIPHQWTPGSHRSGRWDRSQDWTIEPLRRGDIASIIDLFEQMSAKSRRQRFLTSMPRLSTKMLTALGDVDGVRHIAVAARAGGRCVGIARAVATRRDPSVADVAVSVADAHQGKGLGRRLVDVLAGEARARGIRMFEATMDPGNYAARGLARSVTSHASYDDGLIRAEWRLGRALSA